MEMRTRNGERGVEAPARACYRAPVRLYGYWRSTCTWRVRIALHLKNVPFEVAPVHLLQDGGQQRSDDYRSKNPMMQVPLLEWEEGQWEAVDRVFRLGQSVAICELLEERHPTPALLPQPALARAQVRQLVELINAGIQPLQNLSVLQTLKAEGIDHKAWSAQWIRKGFEAVETHLQDTAGQFSFGDTPTLADVFLVPQVYNARRFDVDLTPFPTIVRIDAQCADVPAFQAAHPDRQPDAQSSL